MGSGAAVTTIRSVTTVEALGEPATKPAESETRLSQRRRRNVGGAAEAS